jgi:hypothetical protein
MRDRKFKPGGINEHSRGAYGPAIVSHRSISAPRHPGFFLRRELSARDCPMLYPLSYAGFRRRPDSNRRHLVPM